jgi:hypothetical protein
VDGAISRDEGFQDCRWGQSWDSPGTGLLDEIFSKFCRGNADSRMLLIPIFCPMVLESIKDEVRCTVRDSNLGKVSRAFNAFAR